MMYILPGISSLVNLKLNQVIAPTSIGTLAVNPTAGNLNGTYNYFVTYVTATGETENNQANSTTVSPVNQQVDITNIPVSSDPRVIARKIYRTAAGAADACLGQLVTTINDNTTTTYTDNIADASLGVGVPRLNTTGGVISGNLGRVLAADTDSTALGYHALQSTRAYANVAIGSQALSNSAMTGYRNVAVGMYAMNVLSTGFQNVAVGIHAMNFATTAQQCVAMGFDALLSLTTGQHHVAIGTNALYAMVANYNCTAVGMNSLQNLATGGNSVAVGMQAGQSVTSVSGNVFLGYQAGYFETNGNTLWIDNTQRANLADGKAKALIYGVFASTAAAQSLTFNAGTVGINLGGASPTAALHLPAGTATASTSPLKFTAGTLLTTLELGAMEFTDDGTNGHLYITLNVSGVLTRHQIV